VIRYLVVQPHAVPLYDQPDRSAYKKEVVACLRLVTRGKASYEVRRFPTTTRGLIDLADWLAGSTWSEMSRTLRHYITRALQPTSAGHFPRATAGVSWLDAHA
jgi:hypothetical protein